MTVFAGINGAGKSTLYRLQKLKGVQALGERICPDEILEDFHGDWQNVRDVNQSANIAIRKLHSCVNNRETFNWETTLITGFVIEFLRRAKQQGFKTSLNFIGVGDVEQSIDRVATRVAQGGHGVPEELIRRRHSLQFNNMAEVLGVVDSAMFYDNKENMSVVGIYVDKQMLYADPEVKWVQDIKKSVTRPELASATFQTKL